MGSLKEARLGCCTKDGFSAEKLLKNIEMVYMTGECILSPHHRRREAT
jgi:hypothetical protein